MTSLPCVTLYRLRRQERSLQKYFAENRIKRRNWQRIWMLEICDSEKSAGASTYTVYALFPPDSYIPKKKALAAPKIKKCA